MVHLIFQLNVRSYLKSHGKARKKLANQDWLWGHNVSVIGNIPSFWDALDFNFWAEFARKLFDLNSYKFFLKNITKDFRLSFPIWYQIISTTANSFDAMRIHLIKAALNFLPCVPKTTEFTMQFWHFWPISDIVETEVFFDIFSR